MWCQSKGAFLQINMPHLQQQRGVANQVNHERTLKQKSITQFSSSHSLPRVNCFDRKHMARHETAVCLENVTTATSFTCILFLVFYSLIVLYGGQRNRAGLQQQHQASGLRYSHLLWSGSKAWNQGKQWKQWKDSDLIRCETISFDFVLDPFLTCLEFEFRLESVRFEESIWIKYGNFVRRLAGL